MKTLCSAIFLTCLACLGDLQAQSGQPPQALVAIPLDDRWIVSFAERSFDLEPMRQHNLRGGSREEGEKLVQEFEAATRRDQAEIIRRIEAAGGKVLRQWWIVNAALIEGSADLAKKMQDMPGVARVEADALVPAAGGKHLDKFNHNADQLHKAGWNGENKTTPAIVAIMDSGLDTNMNNSGRPHRMFYPGGDPNNKTGGGMFGSRVSWNKKIGALPADDPHGHGTRASAVAAGSSWGMPRATNGHAFGARIGGYAIGDSINSKGQIISSYATMTSAWQTILTDRTQGANIVAVNNSFGGSQDPLQATQQALDNAAYLGDLVVCISAMNNGPNAYTGGQSCANGLAVAAVGEDSHMIMSWSSRGPVVGDPTRTYPDISACTYSYVPLRDCETIQTTFGGTSCASPQVAGAATLLRAGVPGLRADETKAILLASTMDIRSVNPQLDVNAYGMGFLRDDWAVSTAKDSKLHGRGAVSPTTTTWSHNVAVAKGMKYSIAIAWHRTLTTTTNWSDLDLAVLDGAKEVASSKSPRNLYEKESFTAANSRTYTIMVSYKSLQASLPNGAQEFGMAITPLPSPVPMAGLFGNYGLGCSGNGSSNGAVCLSINPKAAARYARYWYSSNHEISVLFTAPAGGISIHGFEMYLSGLEANAVKTALYPATLVGTPALTPVRTGTMSVERGFAWYRTRFASPYQVAAGQKFFISYTIGYKTFLEIEPDTKTTPAPTRYYRDTCNATWIYWNYALHQGIRINCGSVGTGAQPEFVIDSTPLLGKLFTPKMIYGRPNSPALLITSLNNKTYGSAPLPLELTGYGAPGCYLLLSTDILHFTTTNAKGEAAVPFFVPPAQDLRGINFYQQFAIADPGVNKASAVTTRGASYRIGSE